MELEQPETASQPLDTTAPPVDHADDLLLDDDTSDLGDQQSEEDDLEEEVDGVKLRGKKDALEKLKAERLFHGTFTQKTQQLAEARKAFEAEQVQHRELAQTYIREVAQIVSVDEQLSQFAKVDWRGLSEADPAKAQSLYIQYQELRNARDKLVGDLTQRQQTALRQQTETRSKQLQEAHAVLTREIKGWSKELAGKLAAYGEAQGFPREVMASVAQPAFVKVLHKAHLYDELVKKRAGSPPPPPAPGSRVSGSAAQSTRKLSQLSDAEYMQSRREYIRKHR